MLIGMVGFFGIGFFSEDVAISLHPFTTPTYDLHEIFTVVVFVGLAGAGFLLGVVLVRYPQGVLDMCASEKMSKHILFVMGLFMIFLTPILCFLFLSDAPPSQPFWEWMLMLSIFGWIIPIGFLTLNQINKEELNID